MPNQSLPLDRVFWALGDPTRFAIIERLAQQPSSVSDLAKPFTMALPTFLQHLKILEKHELVTTKKMGRVRRTFNAPIDKVWAAFTNPEILAKWWSPAGMKNYHASTDVREGGEFRYCFESSEGVRYWGKGVYQTINEPTYLSYIDNFTDSEGTPVPPAHYGIPGDVPVPTLVEFVFTAKGDKTDMRIIGENPYDDSMTENMTQGWNSMFDKLVDRLN